MSGEPTWQKRIVAIMREERETSMAAIENLDLPDEVKSDVVGLWMYVQNAIRDHVATEGRTIDYRVTPMTLRMMALECERIYTRLYNEGLTAPSQPPDVDD
jgi:hypothetical protein